MKFTIPQIYYSNNLQKGETTKNNKLRKPIKKTSNKSTNKTTNSW